MTKECDNGVHARQVITAVSPALGILAMALEMKILVLKADQLACSPKDVLSSLAEILNEGYNGPRFKYNVVLTPRISNPDVLVTELGMREHAGRSLLFVAIRPEHCLTYDTTVKSVAGLEWHTPTATTFDTPLERDHVLGMIGYHPYEPASNAAHYEITAFVSFARGLGRTLARETMKYCASIPGTLGTITAFVARVIVQHELVSYYDSLGFQEVDRVTVFKTPPPGDDSTRLESTLQSACDFDLAIMLYHNPHA